MKHIFLIFILSLVLSLQTYAQENLLPTKPTDHEIGIVVHRGANHLAPENTLAAGIKCVEMKLDFIEVDVRESKDGVFYILHDPQVDRTTNGKGTIAQLTSTEVDKLDAGSWFDPSFGQEPIPRLENYLKEIRGKAKIYFDVKAADLRKLIKLVEDMDMAEECFFWFGEDKLALEFRKLSSNLKLKINANNEEEARVAVDKYKANIIECSVSSLTPQFIAYCHKLGLQVMAYPDKNTVEDYLKVIKSKADLVNLDDPVLYLKVLAKQNKNR